MYIMSMNGDPNAINYAFYKEGNWLSHFFDGFEWKDFIEIDLVQRIMFFKL